MLPKLIDFAFVGRHDVTVWSGHATRYLPSDADAKHVWESLCKAAGGENSVRLTPARQSILQSWQDKTFFGTWRRDVPSIMISPNQNRYLYLIISSPQKYSKNIKPPFIWNSRTMLCQYVNISHWIAAISTEMKERDCNFIRQICMNVRDVMKILPVPLNDHAFRYGRNRTKRFGSSAARPLNDRVCPADTCDWLSTDFSTANAID